MTRKNELGKLILFIFLGFLIGGILGESLGLLFGEIGKAINGSYDNVVRSFFVADWPLSFNLGVDDKPVVLDLYMIKFSFGFGLKLNTVSILGMLVSLYIMKWSGER